jgi:hypothetical protein
MSHIVQCERFGLCSSCTRDTRPSALLHRCPQQSGRMWMVAHRFVRPLTLARPFPNSWHHLHTWRTAITLGPQTVTSSRWISTCSMLLGPQHNFKPRFFLCPLVQYGRPCSPDAVQPCFVCAGEQSCHLVVGKTNERITDRQIAVSITLTGIKQETLLPNLPS